MHEEMKEELLGTPFAGATLDSRLVKPGMLFVAVKGEKVDGHAFIDQARAKGAVGIVDGREELARVARAYRRTLKATVIGVAWTLRPPARRNAATSSFVVVLPADPVTPITVALSVRR